MPCKSDTILINASARGVTYVLINVDDLVITGSNPIVVDKFVRALNHAFSLWDLEESSCLSPSQGSLWPEASRAWYTKLTTYLVEHQFMPCKPDTSLLVNASARGVTYVLINVDDLVITGSSPIVVDKFVRALNQAFSLWVLGNLH
ncbi:LOW QUALITY PROTEIN: hypothetical protein V2J09_016255 [Rumex salicifolius]